MKNFTDEKTLLREIKNGNGEAFEFLFNSYYPRLRGYAARFVTDQGYHTGELFEVLGKT